MNYLDYGLILIYILGFLWMGQRFKDNSTGEDYFLGGKQFGWFSLSMSTMATQLSAISFISAPAFVGMKAGGGMIWLTYEFAVPLAMIFLMAFLIPPLFAGGHVSVYGYLEKRFGRYTRMLLSGVFQFSRAFATGIMIYAISLILAGVMDIPMPFTILGIGLVTLIYSLQGGMKAVVYGDVIQMGVLFLGILLCLGFGLYYLGGWESFVEQVDRDRLAVVNFDQLGFRKGEEFGFFPMVIGGFFLYASYYGTDQSQVQRLFSAPDQKTLNKTLLYNGLFRFPITLTYCIMGLVIGTLVMTRPELAASIPADKPDLMMPVFIRDFLPHGVIGLLMVAIFAAAMSSLSSAVNSLSAATVEDFSTDKDALSGEAYVRRSKYAALFWGIVCMGMAFFAGDIAPTVIEAINKITSVFYGPILATFIAAIAIRKIGGTAINGGIIAGVGVNIFLWLAVPQLFWFWWNATGLLVTLGVAFLLSFNQPPSTEKVTISLAPDVRRNAVILLTFFVAIVAFSLLLPSLF